VAERLNWAKLNDVIPPAELIDVRSPADDMSPEDDGLQRNADEQLLEESTALTRFSVVLLSDATSCRGMAKYSAICGSTICQSIPTALHPPQLMTGWMRMVETPFTSLLESPPIRPPRWHV
jgi:hypothetical protein